MQDGGSVLTGRESFSQFEPFATKIFTRRPSAARLREMNMPAYTVRRATVDDLGGLKLLWERACVGLAVLSIIFLVGEWLPSFL